jgi:hypothetical protein
MYEVHTRELPERSVLCLKRNVDERGAWAFGKEFIAILRERPLPKIEGREGRERANHRDERPGLRLRGAVRINQRRL